jgi:hypothetical protein
MKSPAQVSGGAGARRFRLKALGPAECSPRGPLEFVFFEAHIGSGYGGNQYASYRANPGRPRFLLSELRSSLCGDASRLSNNESNVAKCVVCGNIMDQWDSTNVRIFKLVHRPEDA